jgi:UDPglucose 6-dehydrogenase
MKIGFVGQGFIGKNYADDFESRGYEVVRYALEEPYVHNKEKIKACDIVFIAVPTPTTPKGFDYSIVEQALSLVGKNKIAVIKSTLLPGTTEMLQRQFPSSIVLHSPEFLREKTASYDAAHPERNIIGIPIDDDVHREAARTVLSVLPQAPYELVTDSKTAEIIKYGGNCFLYTKVVFMNVLYDLAQELGADFDAIAQAMSADERIGKSHMHPVHASGHSSAAIGRGAGGVASTRDV